MSLQALLRPAARSRWPRQGGPALLLTRADMVEDLGRRWVDQVSGCIENQPILVRFGRE
jgi:hypothetical protein